MQDSFWLSISPSNKSKWIREAIRQRIAREEKGITDDMVDALKASNFQLRKIGINLSQVVRLIPIQIRYQYQS